MPVSVYVCVCVCVWISDIEIRSSVELATVQCMLWIIITFQGQVLTYGEYTVQYRATDAQGNSAICKFRLFVLREYIKIGHK